MNNIKILKHATEMAARLFFQDFDDLSLFITTCYRKGIFLVIP